MRRAHHPWLIGILAAFCVAASANAEETSPWYASAHGGINLNNRWPAEIDFGGTRASGSYETRRGGHYGLIIGRELDRLRVELEFEGGNQRIDRAQVGELSEPQSGTVRYRALLVNAMRDFELSTTKPLFAFVGAGIGIGKVSLPGSTLSDGCNCLKEASGTGFAWQLRGGLEYRASHNNRFFIQFTHLAMPSPGPVQGLPVTDYSNRAVQALSVGYRRMF